MIYDQIIKSDQYKVALATTGAIKSSSREKLYRELGVPYFYQRRWTRRLFLLYTVFSTRPPAYSYDLLPLKRSSRRHVHSFSANLNISRTFLFLISLMNGTNLILAVLSLIAYFVIHY